MPGIPSLFSDLPVDSSFSAQTSARRSSSAQLFLQMICTVLHCTNFASFRYNFLLPTGHFVPSAQIICTNYCTKLCIRICTASATHFCIAAIFLHNPLHQVLHEHLH